MERETHFRHEKREQEKLERNEVEICKSRKDVRIFYKMIKHLKEGFKPGPSFCKSENGNLVMRNRSICRGL